MKNRIFALLLAAVMVIGLVGCNSGTISSSDGPTVTVEPTKAPTPTPTATPEPTEEPSTEPVVVPADVRIAALKGPTAIGLLELMKKSDAGETVDNYTFTLADAPTEVTGEIIQGNYDIAVVPTNLAAALYNKTEGKVGIVANVTLGTLYLVTTRDDINSVADLAGKTVWSTGQASTPEYAIAYILNAAGIADSVTVNYANEASEIAGLFANGDCDTAVLPQPFVTVLTKQNENVHVALDLTEEWANVSENGSGLVMSAVLVQKKFVEEHPDALQRLMAEYNESVAFLSTDLDEAAQLAVDYGILGAAPIAKLAIPKCNITFLTGYVMKDMSNGFLEVLFNSNPQSVGGKMPADDFYVIVPGYEMNG